jgi:2-C-methyl-D-erythritol 4-phosphate cytidylyltransferase
MEIEETVAVVVCAAGASSRMGGVKKEYQELKGGNDNITVLGSVVCAFAAISSVETIVIAIPADNETQARDALPSRYLDAQKPKIIFVTGGKTRASSTLAALRALVLYKPCYVLIHDGARPWVSIPLINNVIEEVKKHKAVIPVLPITDTPKECDSALEGGAVLIKTHLKRANTGCAQTPQGFKFPEILNAHEKAAQEKDTEFTDDAEIWAKYCGQVAAVLGSPENKKITFQEDIC